MDPRTAIIVSASSDIGAAVAERWLKRQWKVYGTYRTPSEAVERLRARAMMLVHCDLALTQSVRDACGALHAASAQWDILVLAPGLQDPIGPFMECSFRAWEESVRVNFTAQLQMVHELLPARNLAGPLGPCVLFFAGGGTNNATMGYSAYTISKIALIKMCELLDAEIRDTRFVIVGPGWVKTKIHDSTLNAGAFAGANYQRTLDKLTGNECTPMEQVLDCCDWATTASRDEVSGRNFSTVFDAWGTDDLAQLLVAHPDMYKLRRFGNDWLVRRPKGE